MSKVHSKKRNSLLLYEFLVRTISRALVEGDKKTSNTALKILKRRFKPGTELYKEFRLSNSLFKTTVSSEAIAVSIIGEAKQAAKNYDVKQLEREKSLLIKNINHDLGKDDFYDQHINEYKTYATIQTLINDWRDMSHDVGRIGTYEDQLVKWLISEKQQPDDKILSEESPGSMRLLMKVMMKKLNEKYGGILSVDQKALIRAYAFSTAAEDMQHVKKKLHEIKNKVITLIDDKNITESLDNEYVLNKLNETKSLINEEPLDEINDSTVTRFMLYAKLVDELAKKD